MRIPIILFALTILLSFSPARAADETFLLQAKAQTGQISQVDAIFHGHRIYTTTANGVAQPPVDEKSDSYFIATLTFAEVKDGSPVAAIVHVDPQTHDVLFAPNGRRQIVNLPIADAKFAIERNDDNTFTNGYKGTIPDVPTALLKSCLTPGTALFPDHPVAVGDQWNPTKTIKPFLNLGANDDATETCVLDSVTVENDHHIAKIVATINEVRHLPLNVQVNLKAITTMRFDIEAGRSLSDTSSSTGTISTPKTEAVQINGTLNDSLEMTSEIVPAAAPVASAADSPTTVPAAAP